MKKRSKVTLFGLLALIAAFGLILTGCPDAAGSSSTETEKTVYTDVRLTPGSHGFAYEDTVIGLATGSTYVIRTGDSWYGVTEDGELGETGTTLADALTDAAPLAAAVAVPESPAVTKIIGLTKGTSYSVYLKDTTTSTDAAAIIDATATGGRNTIVAVSAVSSSYTITISAGVSEVGGSLVLLTDTDGLLAEAAGPVTQWTRIKGAANGLTYQFGTVTGSADLEAVTATNNNYIVLNNINAAFGAVITPSAPVQTTVLATKSQGAEGAAQIGSLTNTAKYAVQWRGDWYPLTAAGLGTKAANVALAARAAEVINNTSATGTNIINDEVYNVYLVGAVTATDQVIDDTGAVAVVTGGFNTIVDIAVLATATNYVKVAAGALSSGSRLIVLVGESLATRDQVSGASIADSMIFGVGTTFTYGTNSTDFVQGTSTVLEKVNEGDRWFTILGGGTDHASRIVLSST